MIDRAASLQPARAPKQQIPLAPCKGRGRFPAHEEDRLCLPSGSVGSILGKATSTTDYLFCFVLFALQLSVCLWWLQVPLRDLSDA